MAQEESAPVQRGHYPELADDFGHWLAGFTDGEGCFWVYVDRRGGRCGFQIALRLDDRAILDELHQRTRVGRIAIQNSPSLRARGSSAQAVWRVQARREVARLVEIFDAFPLRAKKQSDFLIWRAAVHCWLALPHGARKVRGGPGGFVPHDWTALAALADQLKATRASSDDIPPPSADAPVNVPELTLL